MILLYFLISAVTKGNQKLVVF